MDKKRWMHIAIMVILTVGIGLCPPFGSITPLGMKVLGVFIGILYGWIFVDLVWPSVFGFLALGITGITTASGAFSSGIGNAQLIVVLITMVFAGALEEAGFSDLVTNWLLKKKIFQKSPWMLVTGILIIAYIVGATGAAMAAIFVLWTIVLRIADYCGIPKKDPLICFCIMNIVIVSTAGSLIFPFHVGALIYEGFFTKATGITISYVPFIAYSFILTVTMTILMILLGRYVLKLDASKFVLPDHIIAEIEAKTVTKEQKFSVVILVIFMCALLLPEIIPSMPGAMFLSGLGIVGCTMIALLVMDLVVFNDVPLIQMAKTFSENVQWPLILLLAVTFPLADALKSADTGIMATVSTFLMPIVSNMGMIPFMIFSTILLGLLTQITHNVVLGAMFIPFLCPLCTELGGNAITLWFLIYFILNAAYVTPAASMQSAMAHGHEVMDSKYAYILGIVYLIVNLVVLFIVGIPLGNIFF